MHVRRYKKEKESLRTYKEQAANIDQFGGGLGICQLFHASAVTCAPVNIYSAAFSGIADEDDSLEMVANPLVIEMQVQI